MSPLPGLQASKLLGFFANSNQKVKRFSHR